MRARLPLFVVIALAPILGAAGACGGAQNDDEPTNETLSGVVANDIDENPNLVTIEHGHPLDPAAMPPAPSPLPEVAPGEATAPVSLADALGDGPPCTTDADCGDGAFCAFDIAHCGEASEAGVCMTPPAMCTMDWTPVCGCDGVTYGNACGAWAAGANVAAAGPCEGDDPLGQAPADPTPADAAPPGPALPDGAACTDDGMCGEGEFCAFETGHCGELDRPGVCMEPPMMCTRDWRPVCGCDGRTYGNACGAWSAGTSIAHTGECPTPPTDDGTPIPTEPGIGDGAGPPPVLDPAPQPTSLPSE